MEIYINKYILLIEYKHIYVYDVDNTIRYDYKIRYNLKARLSIHNMESRGQIMMYENTI